jgi:hypothetical protein
MIETGKLDAIRDEIEKPFASVGEDPIQRLEHLIASAKRRGDSAEVFVLGP